MLLNVLSVNPTGPMAAGADGSMIVPWSMKSDKLLPTYQATAIDVFGA
ncbi:hypothetical protein HMPREF0004_1347 [Achromobacter piechaudii ATCC 43553]|uniref:Uncharacterized protein n=1 Tax=Achromobacter piechaudii ATCC 43553 TaxID=742159 RepID=D4X7A0_9BURK|nr:hypothetical protein HMPREF0004_1347 [Achromobacter piechaudii ATCC 43553]